jgi:putative DNA primase/helicase
MAKKEARDDAWQGRFQCKSSGEPYPSLGNAQLAFQHHVKWQGVLAYDEFIGDIVCTKLPPWHGDYRPGQFSISDWLENDMRRAAIWLERTHRIRAPVPLVKEALYVVADTYKRHPVRTWLRSLKWDRVHRLDDMFVKICGASDDEYSREISKNFLIGAVARVMRPGCQLDSMPILEGKQGVGKTSFLKTLFGEWFLSSNIDITTKDGYQVLQRKWCAELGELDSLNRRQVSAIKQFVSQSVDTYRPSYGHKAQDFPRQCVFAGTTNDFVYLKDGTGARRFWPLVILGIKQPNGLYMVDLDSLREWREQLFAEALVRYKKGEAWHITDPELIKQHALIAEEKREIEPWETIGQRWVDRKLASEGGKLRISKGVTTYDLLVRALRLDPGKLTKYDEMRAAETLKALGFTERERVSTLGGREWIFRKPGSLTGLSFSKNEEVSQIRGIKQATVRPVRPKSKILLSKKWRSDK